MKTQLEGSEARELAAQTAEIILSKSYRSKDQGIQDVILFGSVVDGKTANDIDLLLLHNHWPLDEFGYATTYRDGHVVCDPTLKLQHGKFQSVHLLKACGSHRLPDGTKSLSDVDDDLFYATRGDNTFQGTLYLGLLDPIHITEERDISEVRKLVQREIHRVSEELVVAHVATLIESIGETVNETLDVHAMNVGLLDPKLATERAIAIAQCEDRTYWHEVLTKGRLYNRTTKLFDTNIDEKYKGATDLFLPR